LLQSAGKKAKYTVAIITQGGGGGSIGPRSGMTGAGAVFQKSHMAPQHRTEVEPTEFSKPSKVLVCL